MMRGLMTFRTPMQRKPQGFTLIELMVVIGIIVLLMSVLLVGTRAMTQGNSMSQATNVLSAYLSNARAVAMQRGTYAGVALFEDPDRPAQTAMRIIVSDPSQVTPATSTLISFTADMHYDIVYLPRDMDAAVIDGANAFRNKLSGLTTATEQFQSRIILFDQNGRLVVRDGLTSPTYGGGVTYNRGAIVTYTVGTDISCYVCMVDGTTGVAPTVTGTWHKERLGLFAYVGGEAYGRSSPALAIYDARAFDTANSSGFVGYANADDWIQKNGQIVAVNAYTGSLIR